MSEMSFMNHLTELRTRLVKCLWAVAVGFVIAYSNSERIFDFLIRPLCEAFGDRECKMVYISVAEPFFVYLKVGLVGGVFGAVPVIFYQLWMFLAPGLRKNEKGLLLPFVFSASVMFVGGAMMGYFYVFPFAFDFFLNLTGTHIQPMISMSSYFSFSSMLLFAFGTLFELPVFVVLLNILGVLPAATLWGTWRYAIVGIFVLSAVLTPADPYTMILLAVPLTVLYMGSLVVCTVLEKTRRKTSESEDDL